MPMIIGNPIPAEFLRIETTFAEMSKNLVDFRWEVVSERTRPALERHFPKALGVDSSCPFAFELVTYIRSGLKPRLYYIKGARCNSLQGVVK